MEAQLPHYMKKFFLIVVAFFILAVIICAGIFYYNNLRGIGPAIGEPPQDITDLIPDKPLPPDEYKKAVNNTDFPLALSDGFAISIFAKNLVDPRVIIHSPNGGLLVSIPSQGKVVAVRDADGDGVANSNITVAEGLDRPHGLATKCDADNNCKLYIAESGGVNVYDFDSENSKAINGKRIIDLPAGGRHFSRTIMFMPYPNEDKLLVSVGSSCDTCYEDDYRRAAILIANSDGSDLKVFAKGLRNSVFMAINPATGEIWATEMGRDLLGDNLPPDEINIIKEGGNYGWPICYGKNIHDTLFDKNTYIRNPCLEPFETESYIDLPAHSAPLGLAFVPEEGWPEDYRHNLLVAYHGSWNRTDPAGYKIVRHKLDAEGNYLGEEDFLSGWLVNNKTSLGRPVGIIMNPSGVMYVSDDKAGVIYRIAIQQ